MNKRYLPLFILLLLLSKTALCQEIIDTPIEHYLVYPTQKPAQVRKPFPVTGRIIGINLENVKDATVMNICTAETTKTDNNGIYHITAAKGDTLAFMTTKYSVEMRGIKPSKENLNIIMIKRKADGFSFKKSSKDYNKAVDDDNELYRILEKDAKLEGKWVY
jgi:hypothetical protein